MKPTYQKHSHCSYCGQPFAQSQPWPRQCTQCGNTSFLNPLPVAVVLAPVDAGLLLVRRAIEPCKGQLALPGGYINYGESWQQAAAREVFEETGLRLDPGEIMDFRVRSAPDSTLLIFGLARPRQSADLPAFEPSSETVEVVICHQPVPLAFSLHDDAARAYFKNAQRG